VTETLYEYVDQYVTYLMMCCSICSIWAKLASWNPNSATLLKWNSQTAKR